MLKQQNRRPDSQGTSTCPQPEVIDPRTAKRDWLLSDYADLTWKFATPIPGNPPSSVWLSWDTSVGQGERLSDIRYHEWLDLSKRATWWYRESPKTKCSRDSTCHAFATDLRRGVIWFINAGVITPDAMMPVHLNNYEVYLAGLKLSNSTVQSRLIAIRMIWILRSHLHSTLSFEPYRTKRALSETARRISRANKHTTTIPPQPFYEMCEHALQWLEHTDRIITIRDAYLLGRQVIEQTRSEQTARVICQRDLASSLTEHSQAWPYVYEHEGRPVQFLATCLKCLYASCIVLIIAFTAIRKHQVALIPTNPIMNVGQIEFLIGAVRKSSPDENVLATKHALDSIARQAVEHLDHLSRYARVGGISDLLLRDPLVSRGDSFGKPLQTRDVYSLFDEFANSLGFNVDQYGSLRPQMIRRAHTLIYVWQYEFPDLLLLQKHLRQSHIRSNSAYTNEANLTLFQSDANKALAYQVLEESLTGQKPIVGGFAHYIAKLRSGLKVLSLDRIRMFVAQLVENHDITFTAHPHGYCVRATHRKQFARCSNDGMGPDYARRRDCDCALCPNFATHRLFREHWENQQRVHRIMDGDPRSSDIERAAAKLGLEAATAILEEIDGAEVRMPS